MQITKAFSKFRNREILIVDDCGCNGGISEEEITQHGFHGSSWPIAYRIVCNDCNKTLTELPNKPDSLNLLK